MPRGRSDKRRSRAAKVGLPPGALVHVGPQRPDPVVIDLLEYAETDVQESMVLDVKDLTRCLANEKVSWVNINGIHDTDVIRGVGEVFGIHSLVLEDVLNTDHRPKVETFGDHVFFTFKMMWHDESGRLESEQVSIIFGSHWVISFQERKGDIFEPIRERIRQNSSVVRRKGADFLVYRLIDVVVDHYFLIMERIDDRLDELEERITTDMEGDHMVDIKDVKREMLRLRKSFLPLREAVGSLEKGITGLVTAKNHKYFKDVHDHLTQLSDILDGNREIISMLMDLYLANVSNRMNNVMKLLTIVSTIFIPLTFIAGIYGMNFELMPELAWPWAYFAVLGIMLVIALAMLLFFRRKKWL